MGRELPKAILYGLVPLCIVERLFERRQSGCLEMAEAAKFGTSTENTPMLDCISQLHRPEKEMMEDPEMMEMLKMHMMSAQIMGGMH